MKHNRTTRHKPESRYQSETFWRRDLTDIKRAVRRASKHRLREYLGRQDKR